jgi:hypothetical protein
MTQKPNKSQSRVARINQKTKSMQSEYDVRLDPCEKILSFNKVTGFSLNFPIFQTCLPTEVCASRCYYATGPVTWPNSIKKQLRLYNSVKNDPLKIAKRLAKEITDMRKKITFIRWNGGGDLFLESVKMLNHFAGLVPSLPIWVVTRIPKFASMIDEKPNTFIHFSLDLKSLDRRKEFEQIKKKSNNYFYSYQCDKGEIPLQENLLDSSVLFYDCYKPEGGGMEQIDKSIICPLNLEQDITGVCEECRRCFNTLAVSHRKSSPVPAFKFQSK